MMRVKKLPDGAQERMSRRGFLHRTALAASSIWAAPVVAAEPPSHRDDGKLPEAANRGDVGLGFPRYAARMASTGHMQAAVLFVDFSDAPAQESPEQMYARIRDGGRFYQTVSYGRLHLSLIPYLKWLRMPEPSTAYSDIRLTFEAHRAYIEEAIRLADPDVDFSRVQAVYVMAPLAIKALPNGPAFAASRDYAILADGNSICNGMTSGADLKIWGSLWLNHEGSHTLGLADLYAFQGATHRFVGDFSVMGTILGKAPEMFAYERWLLGWLDDDQIVVQTALDKTTTLSAIENRGSIKAVMVRTGRTSAILVECRRPLGYDHALPKPGALVYVVDTSIVSGSGPIRVVPHTEPLCHDSPLALNESVTVGKVTITVMKATETSDTVRVTIAG